MSQLGDQSLLQRNLTVRIVQRPGRSFQIPDIDHPRIIPVTPQSTKREKTALHINGKTIRPKFPFIVAQMKPVGNDFQISLLVNHLKIAGTQIPVPHRLRRPVLEHTMLRILQPDQPVRQHTDPVLFPRNNILLPAYASSLDLITRFHTYLFSGQSSHALFTLFFFASYILSQLSQRLHFLWRNPCNSA